MHLGIKTTWDHSDSQFSGLEIGTVSVKWVRRKKSGEKSVQVIRHDGDPHEKIQEILDSIGSEKRQSIVVTGNTSKLPDDVTYRSETECIEKALAFHNLQPDILLSLGGETFVVYTLRNGKIRNIISSSKCAAGTGEFLCQQFQRMGYSLEEGIKAYPEGSRVDLATRCSVHCKSDATHKLNKGECTRADIVRSLVDSLAEKIRNMIELTRWSTGKILVTGGVANNLPFIDHLKHLMEKSEIILLEESPYFCAFGASLFASEDNATPPAVSRYDEPGFTSEMLAPLKEYEHLLDYRVKNSGDNNITEGHSYILGVDAGSTTTKAVLFDVENGSISAGCYLRTLGNPVLAVKECLNDLIKKTGNRPINIIQAGVTGSAREMVSVYLDNCLSFNEILAHARAAQEEIPDVDTVFEIGGQDSKYVSFLNGVPVDYAMNEGCSAGTGSFLEESVSLDMGITFREISAKALMGEKPISFGERCAAFINTDLRSALQQGAGHEDVIAGLVYSIADNYISRIAESRPLGKTVLFQGGVALNRAVALAMVARSGRKIIVPSYPELMGCVGTALMARDLLKEGHCEKRDFALDKLASGSIELKDTFRCKVCRNLCEIQRIVVREKVYPFGGLCSKYEMKRHGSEIEHTGLDMVELRNNMMFKEFGPVELPNPKGNIGLPIAMTAYELFPFYAKLINELGYNVVLSETSKIGNARALSPICYPGEIAHGAIYDLINKKTDYILLPYLLEFEIAEGYRRSFTCPSTSNIPDIIRAAFKNDTGRFLSPHIALSDHLIAPTRKEIVALGKSLHLSKDAAISAFENAFGHYKKFREKLNSECKKMLANTSGERGIIITGRPYVTCSDECNFAMPRKLISRGYNVITSDMLPMLGDNRYANNIWHYTSQVTNAIAYSKKYPNLYICLFSCFSCGPDAVMYHVIRKELAGKAFCYLEIDSHTAHAGIETRIGAFLDIIEEKVRREGGGRKKALHAKDTAEEKND
ncbi:MAG: hypothetical protein JW925_11950 [Syntrophaceae bacterium]|nr:hypothetical protein [Syntrophaceae bacterium]